MEKVASAIIRMLSSYLEVLNEKRMFDRVQNLIESQLAKMDFLVSVVRTQVEQLLPFSLEQFPYGAPSRHPLENGMEKLS